VTQISNKSTLLNKYKEPLLNELIIIRMFLWLKFGLIIN